MTRVRAHDAPNEITLSLELLAAAIGSVDSLFVAGMVAIAMAVALLPARPWVASVLSTLGIGRSGLAHLDQAIAKRRPAAEIGQHL